MPGFEQAVRARLRARPEIDGPAQGRIDWGLNATGFPAVRLDGVSDVRTRHMTGRDAMRRPRVQIDVMALEPGTMVALREAVIDALASSGSFGGVRFLAAREVTVRGANEDVGGKFVFRDIVEMILPYMET